MPKECFTTCKTPGCIAFAQSDDPACADTRKYYCVKCEAAAIKRGETGVRPDYTGPVHLLHINDGHAGQQARSKNRGRPLTIKPDKKPTKYYQYDDGFHLLAEFPNAEAAGAAVGKAASTVEGGARTGQRAGGFYWFTDPKLAPPPSTTAAAVSAPAPKPPAEKPEGARGRKKRPVRNTDTGRVYGSAREAAAAHGVSKSMIYLAINQGVVAAGQHFDWAGEGTQKTPEDIPPAAAPAQDFPIFVPTQPPTFPSIALTAEGGEALRDCALRIAASLMASILDLAHDSAGGRLDDVSFSAICNGASVNIYAGSITVSVRRV